MTFTIHAPQAIMLIFMVLTWLVHVMRNGESREFNPVINLFDQLVTIAILYWGGFFSQ